MTYIDKSRALGMLERFREDHSNLPNACLKMIDVAMNIIKQIPAADVEEVKHGTWTFARSGRKVVCSCCETPAPFKNNETYHTLWSSEYCPNCGAKMNGGNLSELSTGCERRDT